MAQTATTIPIYLEIGQTRTFAAALDWPGWSRSGRGEAVALQSLFEYGPRYARVLEAAGIPFSIPTDASALVVVERQPGNATTDFGAPNLGIAHDAQPYDEAELERAQHILKACWQAFDQAVQEATGRSLRKGPRGGGRDLDKIVEHVLGAGAGYLTSLGGKPPSGGTLPLLRLSILDALAASARGEISPRGARGGLRWTPRYFVRRLAWHDLDHAWEIEDRAG